MCCTSYVKRQFHPFCKYRFVVRSLYIQLDLKFSSRRKTSTVEVMFDHCVNKLAVSRKLLQMAYRKTAQLSPPVISNLM